MWNSRSDEGRSRGAVRSVRAAVLALLVAVACSSPEAPIPVATVTVSPSTGAVIVGTTQSFSAAIRDGAGNALSGRTVAWSSSNASIASMTSAGLLTAVAPGTVVVTAASEGRAGTAAVTVLPIPVASLTITPGSASLIAGRTQQFSATPLDARGNALSGRTITWVTNSATTATIDATGLLTTIAPGSVTVTAGSEGQSVTAQVNVLPVPVATVLVTPGSANLVAGTTQQLTALTRDATGGTLTGRFITWSSDTPAIATIDALGLITAVSPGVAAMAASSEGQSGSATITVTPGSGGPTITSITPASLQPGTNVFINGVGFGDTNAANAVTIGGVVAPVVFSTTTQLTVAVPCVEGGNQPVRVVSKGLGGNAVTRFVTVPQRTLGVGQSIVLTSNAASVCNELLTAGTNARYIVAVFSGSTTASSLVDFELTGNTPTVRASAARVDMPRRSSGPARGFAAATIEFGTPRSAGVEAGGDAGHDAVHYAFLERDRAQYEELRLRAMRSPTPRAALRAAELPAVGDMRSLYYTFGGGCNDTTRVVRGKALFIGTRSIIWEDSANTLQSDGNSTLAGYYARLGQIFDQDQYESVKNGFGDPLLRDAVTDNDGRVHMVFSQRLNGSGAAAYVTSCDQYPTTTSRGSNFGQFFYGNVPTTATLNLNSTASPDGWFYFMARTVVHEVKHIASLSARVANNAPSFEQSWLEEGTARHAEELWVRESLHRVAWKGNTGFGTAAGNGLFCDFSPSDATCNAGDPLRRPSYGMRRHFNEIRDKMLEPWNWSPYGDGPGQSTSGFYQVAWSLVRYTIDRYAASDADFFRTLINARTNGVTNLSSVAGVPMDQLIGGWGLALFADDYPGLSAPNPDMQFPTWNLRSIYAGLNELPSFASRWNRPFPIQPAQLSFGSFVSPLNGLRGGAHAYFELSGAVSGTQLIGIRAASGGATPSNLRIAIARLQ